MILSHTVFMSCLFIVSSRQKCPWRFIFFKTFTLLYSGLLEEIYYLGDNKYDGAVANRN